MRALVVATLALLAAPASAAAQAPLPPSLTTDTAFALSGIAEYDFAPGAPTVDDGYAAALDPARDRQYAVGLRSPAGPNESELAIVARRANGMLDPAFAGDGSLALDLAPGGYESGNAIALLPDGRLRIAGTLDSGSDDDLFVAGLLPDGSTDPAFGTEGLALIALPGDEHATSIAVDPDGRIAVAGLSGDDSVVAVLEPGGTPLATFGTGGAQIVDAGAGDLDRATDVVWGARGPIALAEIELGGGTCHPAAPGGPVGCRAQLLALTETGAPDPAFAGAAALDQVGTDLTAAALLRDGDRLWVTGSIVIDDDVDAYLARVDGATAQARRFDMRGGVFPPTQQVVSTATDLTLVPGEPDTLVVGGSVRTDRGEEVAAAAFNRLDADVAALQATDLAIPVEGQGAAIGVAGGPGGVVALTTWALDYSFESGTGTGDFSIGMARMLVDAEKRCDLALAVVGPLELTMRGLAPAPVTLRVTNNGKRACGGTIAASAPWTAAPALATGKLASGASVVLTAALAYPAPLPADDTITFKLAAPGDAALGDNVAKLRAIFSFCDLRLRLDESPRVIGTEGARRYGFTVRNAGTADCARAAVFAGGSARRALASDRFTVPAGQSVTEEVFVAARRGLRPGSRAAIRFAVGAAADVNPADNRTAARPLVVRVADSSARRPEGGRRFTGTAKAARRTPGVRRAAGKVARVEIAVRRIGKGCRWLAGPAGGLRALSGLCDRPVWVPVRGTEEWRLRLSRALPKGRYVLHSRAVTRNGAVEGMFSFKDRNKVRFRID